MENYINSITDHEIENSIIFIPSNDIAAYSSHYFSIISNIATFGSDDIIPNDSSNISNVFTLGSAIIPNDFSNISNVNTFSPYIVTFSSNINSGNVYSTLSPAFSHNYSNIILNDIKCKDLIYNSTKLSINNDDIKFKSELIAPYTYKYLFLYKNIKFDTILKINPINYEHFANSKFIDMVKIIENLSINEDDIEIKLICKSITNHDYFVNKVLSKKIVISI